MTRMNRTSWWPLYAAAVLAAALWHPLIPAAAAQSDAADAGTVTFTTQGLPKPRATDVQSVASRRVLRAFLTEHPDIGRSEPDGQTLTGTTLFAGSELAQKWTRGEIGMQLAYLDEQMLADINPQLVGIAPAPVGPHGTRGSEVNARMFGVFAQTSPQQQLAAMRYIWFRTGPVAERLTTDILVENGYGPFVNPTLL